MAAAGKDEMRILLTPDGNDEAFLRAGYFNMSQGHVLQSGPANGFATGEDVVKVYNVFLALRSF